jgi:putative CocE/NonD family hydrolase
VIVGEEERRGAPIAIARTLRRLPTLLSELPLADLDEFATGERVDWYRDAMAHPRRDDAYWVARDYAAGVSKVTAPVQLIGGWYDIFLPWMLEDFCVLQAAGRNVQLTIGPWTHTAPGGMAAGIREGLGWLRARLLGDGRLVRAAAVRVLVTGERSGGGWRELPCWPPPGTSDYRLWLGDHARLEEHPLQAATADGDRYRYDPSDPTPSLGGPVLLARAPVVDNRPLEVRTDVLTYTASPLQSSLEAIGPVRVELYVRAGSPFFDVFARVCDVDEDGASWNVCDALARVTSDEFDQLGDGSWRVAFDRGPMGHRFAVGHSIRLQVSSGAHPRYARNPGTGEDPMTATALQSVDVEVLHDEPHPSHLILPRSGVR